MKNIVVLLSALLFSSLVNAQVKFNLSYQEATKVYTVSILPEVSWGAPKNMVSSAQVVLRVAANQEFTPGITSLVPGLTWADNAYIEHPDGAPEYTFVCISLVNGPTTQIPLADGQEVPLFSFVNAGNGCAGQVVLLANDDPMVQSVRGAGFNITQHFAVLGARGNAFTGLINSAVDCSPLTSVDAPTGKVIDEVKVSPVPADNVVNIQWTLLTDQQEQREMLIFDARGREVFRQKISGVQGRYSMHVQVANWQAGLYSMQFVFAGGQRTPSWNLMVIH